MTTVSYLDPGREILMKDITETKGFPEDHKEVFIRFLISSTTQTTHSNLRKRKTVQQIFGKSFHRD